MSATPRLSSPLALALLATLLLAGCAGLKSPEEMAESAKSSAQSGAEARVQGAVDGAVSDARGRVRVPDAQVPEYPDVDGIYRDAQGRPIELSREQQAAADERLRVAGKETGGGWAPWNWGKGKAAERARETALEVPVGGGWKEGALHCGRDACSVWYRVRVDATKKVVIEADAPADPALPDLSLALYDASIERLGVDDEAHRRPRKLTETLPAGLYWINVYTPGEHEIQLSYKLRARPYVAPRRKVSRPRAPAPPPRPKFVAVEGALLEVERSGGEPVAVLIELGRSKGLAPGQKGELIEAGRTIGQLEVVDVYAQGSRARIVGALRAPITLDTQARIMKPAP